MFERFILAIDKIFSWIEDGKKQQRERILAKRAAYLTERRKEIEKKSQIAIQREMRERAKARRDKLSSFTTIEEFRSIIESPLYKELSEKNREIFLQHVNELRKENLQFAADYQNWQERRARKRTAAPKDATPKKPIPVKQRIYRV